MYLTPFRLTQTTPEISDLLVEFAPDTLTRRRVSRAACVARLRAAGDGFAARLVAALPARDDWLDDRAVDALLVTVHAELQRLSEEFEHGRRVRALLRPLLAALAAVGWPGPWRVVDVGCGTGFVLRWLAAAGGLGPGVELVGVDYHPALIAEATRLAAAEALACTFLAADAFRLATPATIYLSTGVLHHFRGPALPAFFAQQAATAPAAWLHFDFQPSRVAPIGAWLFHLVRMRQALAQHDGTLSAVRAHPGTVLLAAARHGASTYRSCLYGTRFGPLPRVFHTLLGVQPALLEPVRAALGRRAGECGPWA
jgi:SAM-dependent methyltransferase